VGSELQPDFERMALNGGRGCPGGGLILLARRQKDASASRRDLRLPGFRAHRRPGFSNAVAHGCGRGGDVAHHSGVFQDLIAGRIDYVCNYVSTALPAVQGGTAKVLATLAHARSTAFPNIGTAQEQGLNDIDVSAWNALFMPKNSPTAIVNKLNAAASPHGLRLPPDPSSGRWASLGGMVSTNAAGARSVRYGSVRPWVEALTIVTAEGDVVVLRRGKARPESAALTRFDGDAAPLIAAITSTSHGRPSTSIITSVRPTSRRPIWMSRG
jgi:hypothetical protein